MTDNVLQWPSEPRKSVSSDRDVVGISPDDTGSAISPGPASWRGVNGRWRNDDVSANDRSIRTAARNVGPVWGYYPAADRPALTIVPGIGHPTTQHERADRDAGERAADELESVIRLLSADEVAHSWEQIRHLIVEYVDSLGNRTTVCDVLRDILSGHKRAWAIGNPVHSLVLTEIVTHPRGDVCRMIGAMGHDPAAWAHLINEGVAWARSIGCVGVDIVCRPGWERLLRGLGFSKRHSVLSREL